MARNAAADGGTGAGGKDARRKPGAGTIAQRLRLAAGLVLFTFVLTHFLNHALGNVSLAAMQAGQDLRFVVWSSWPGQILLYGALGVHVSLALVKLARRRTWRMPVWEGLQIALGLAITCILIKHIVATRGAMTAFHTFVDYRHELSALWLGYAFWQSVLLLIVWAHVVLGLHYWLRLKRWYSHARPWLATGAVLVPALALTGWLNAARLLDETGGLKVNVTADEAAALGRWIHLGRWGLVAVLAGVAAAILARRISDRFAGGFSVSYVDGRRVVGRPGATLLEISRVHGVPHLSICGGRARCSTCRVEILAGASGLEPPANAERTVLARLGAGPEVRLACQIRPAGDLVVRPLLDPARAGRQRPSADDRYRWGVEQPVTVMFVDLRGFTALSEGRLPYDVVFILNRYLDSAAAAIRAAGGMIDKVMGDGIMALFGVETGREEGARQALAAVLGLAGALERVNADLTAQLEAPLRLGVGVHTGPAILGRIGLAGDIGAAAQLTALGDTVNVASRLEGASKELDGFAVISAQTLLAAGIPDLARDGAWAVPVPASPHALAVRGRAQALQVWAVRDPAVLAAALDATHVPSPGIAENSVEAPSPADASGPLPR
ncbi:adenylate cyclase [Breoghania corrubedonensis]|uniref:Adenylate cyclase n=1 Tax=Breoghania corrubedonensis TaxID=665038 RepID=A0A2T5VGZ8_9HYPH|nr:adenylate/guanylate cyclase domain-containing protein [Breoghania corrubedonensis]PTW63031.1 adenylate cyclase [Breoghania corrubedonensis]